MEAELKTNKLSPRLKRRDFRHFLQDELSARCARNSNYSLRSFAKSLSISPSALSAMIKGKRPITNKMKEKLGLKLGLSLEKIQNLLAQPHGNTKNGTETVESDLFQQITIDTFSVISELHHYALLELMKTTDFKWDSKWIAHRLGKTVSEINIAVERLERIGLLDKDDAGNLIDSTTGFSTDIREGLSTQAQRRFQEKSLERSIEAIRMVSIEDRDNTSMTMAINTKDLPQAKKMIKEFRRRFCGRLEENSQLNEVYQLTISFVPLSNLSGDKK